MSSCSVSVTAAPSQVQPRSRVLLGLIGLCLCYWGSGPLANVLLHDRQLRDFLQEWTSARNWQAGRPVYQDMAESIPFHLPKSRAGELQFNPHPPAAVLVALPFRSLDYRGSLLAWNAVSLALIVIAIRNLTGRIGYSLTIFEQLFVGGLVACSSVLKSQVLYGQLNGVLLLLLAGAWLAQRHQWPSGAGFCIGLAVSIKLFPAFLLLFFVARREWRAVIVAAVTMIAANGIALSVLGAEAFRDYVLVVMPQAGRFCDTWPNASLLGFLTRLFDGTFGNVSPLVRVPVLAKVLWLSLSAIGVVLTWRTTARNRSLPGSDLAFAAWTMLMLLVSPITWDHYFLLAIPVLLALWRDERRDASDSAVAPVSKLFLLGATLILVELSPYSIWKYLVPGFAKSGMTPSIGTPWQLLTMISIQFYVCVAVFFACWRRVPQATPQTSDH